VLPKLSTTLALLLGTSALLAGCQAGDPPPPAARTVLVQEAGSAALSSGIYTGEIRARHEVDLAFRVGGKIVRRAADLGDSVKTGQVLAQLELA
jgi:multidrug efflux pump subunit AcrA (membrane-fusion protein)